MAQTLSAFMRSQSVAAKPRAATGAVSNHPVHFFKRQSTLQFRDPKRAIGKGYVPGTANG
jgi:hypothetical protein